MAIHIKLICVGKLKERFYTDAVNEYLKRLAGYCKTEIFEIPEHSMPPGNVSPAYIGLTLEKERIAIKRACGAGQQPAGTLVIALCVEGREMDSVELSEFLSDRMSSGTSSLCFIIGGSLGLHEDIKNKADIKLSMSKMTFPHNLARVILLEQLYRAFKIIEGGKYHK